eukprot:CAMPEP_0206474168 /NCGR_PEP_ID=MMETSP0324_2-20121206/33316_1 /ASSEMBLY_ACC=CAM_ASM_000836 /TAXON_ID=2866 /ORGANISM="Crypthecodinium cohnii, Strain Seligo" /LENGTH=417 /DNA_ID=CAMNT_0053949269 /DNA_START=48 /DNA_END=1301 /DNA_ORIENTATION=-
MTSHHDALGPNIREDYPEPMWAKEFLLSIVFTGSVVGMLTMGYLGDFLGLKVALAMTNGMIVLGALASATLSWGSAETVWTVIFWSRFILGMGVGGNYPLSAAKASQSIPLKEAIARTGAAFFWQGPGSVAPYLVALLLLMVPRDENYPTTSVQFRLLYAIGTIPSLAVMLAVLREKSPPKVKSINIDDGSGEKKESNLSIAFREPQHWKALSGTAGTWFMFDVAYYGFVIFSPSILKEVFGSEATLVNIITRSTVLGVISIFGTALGVGSCLRWLGPKRLNVAGQVLAGILFAAFAVVHEYLPDATFLQFGFLCLLIFTLSVGPNVSTFLLPIIAFPEEIRSTFHGLSSASAKVGAMVGSMLFPIVSEHAGVTAVMGTQAVVCLLGAAFGQFLIEDHEDEEGYTTDGFSDTSSDCS